jgi:hypothetical protein
VREPRAGRLRELALLGLLLLLPPLALQLAGPVERLDADAVEYYSHLRSLYFDHDVDFADEFQHFGILERWDKRQPTVTGHRRTIFSVGPALLWMPFYAVGDALARVRGEVEEGYSDWHIRSVMLASLVYGVVGLLLLYGVLRDVAGRAAVFWTLLLLQYATFLYWYVAYEPVMSHALSFFVAAATLAAWWPRRHGLGVAWAVALGLLIGVAATVRWQNGVLLLLPAATLTRELWRRPASAIGKGLATLVAFAIAASPQLLAWKAIFGSYVLLEPPHGRDFLRLSHPYLLETFFSSRHGLLYWSPVLWAGFLGVFALLRRSVFTGLAVLVPLTVMSYVNVCSGDWWAGGSFSNRRFDSVLPFLALGLALSLEAVLRLAARRPGLVLAGLLAPALLWNALLLEQYGRPQMLPRDLTVSFATVTENNAALLAEAVGTPLAWPANWLFAWRQRLPAASFDLMVGKYLFYRQNNLGGVIAMGDPRSDPALLGEGWSARRPCGKAVCREVQGRARVFVPLDVPQPLEATLRAAGTGSLEISVNGQPLARVPLRDSLEDARLRLPAALLHRELNELALRASGSALVSRLVFAREAPRGAP